MMLEEPRRTPDAPLDRHGEGRLNSTMLTRTQDSAPIGNESVGEATYRRIRADILQGVLLPDDRLRLDRLRERYGASVSTLRELLSRLAAEGLVVAEGQRGFAVAPVSARNLRELAALRLLLEQHALRLSFHNGDMNWEARVVAAHHKLVQAERRLQQGDLGESGSWKRYDREFHQALIAACGSDTLTEAYAPIYDKYLRYLMIAGIYRGQVADDEHQALLDCAIARDADRACAILRTHIEDCVEFTLKEGAYDFA